jgi:ribosomal protein S18 acetylase RimI-like enzyme
VKARPPEIVDAVSARLTDHAAALVFEYMALTCREVGWLVPSSPADLPGVLRAELDDFDGAYRMPGMFLLACGDGEVLGGVGLQARGNGSAEVKRLYVRAGARGSGLGRQLMAEAHRRARSAGFARLVLDVLPSRVRVIDLYRSLGYTETEPYVAEPVDMVYLALDLARRADADAG